MNIKIMTISCPELLASKSDFHVRTISYKDAETLSENNYKMTMFEHKNIAAMVLNLKFKSDYDFPAAF